MSISKRILLITGGVFLLLIAIFLNWDSLEISWVKVFKLDKQIIYYNNGEPDGKLLVFRKGKLYAVGNLVNGQKQGWETIFYKNGSKKSKTFFVNGLPAGRGYIYTPEGKLYYSGTFRYGIPYGSWYGYYPNGKIKKYILHDIDTHDSKFAFNVDYTENGNLILKSMKGFVVSPNLYSIDVKSKSLVPISIVNNKTLEYLDINDLYISVANPKYTKLNVKITINNKLYKFNDVQKNTIKIPNAFSKNGKYNVFIESSLYDKTGKVINGIDIKNSLYKR